MTFKECIDSLSKSSASAVRTVDAPTDLLKIKDYLYIKTEIEEDFKEWLDADRQSSDIIFLCGSSGDGKSEILTKYHKDYSESFLFHLDGTHSYHPDKGAIETLNEQFTEYKASGKSLVVGINIGMLGNYVQEGDDEHQDIKDSIDLYLKSGNSNGSCQFLSFEDFPKYRMENDVVKAPFVEELLRKITSEDSANPFYAAYSVANEKRGRKSRSIINYRLLCKPEVRSIIIRAILQTRLQYNLFLTARTLLDAIYHMLSDKGYIYDNLFSSNDGQLLDALSYLDPNLERNKQIDMFLIQRSLEIDDLEYEAFKNLVVNDFGVKINNPQSCLRLCYLLQDSDIANQFHMKISASFNQSTLESYLEQWLLHTSYSGERDQRKNLKAFYSKTFFKALKRYANRKSPKLSNQYFFLKKVNHYVFASEIKMEADFKSIAAESVNNLGAFDIRILVEGKPLKAIEMNADLYELIQRINHGYRPNKYDKSSIVIIEELIEEIQSIGNTLNQIIIEKKGETSTIIFDEENEEITLEGAL